MKKLVRKNFGRIRVRDGGKKGIEKGWWKRKRQKKKARGGEKGNIEFKKTKVPGGGIA